MLSIIIAGLIAAVYTWFFYLKTSPALTKKQRIFSSALRFLSAVLLILFLLTPIIHYIRSYTHKPIIVLLRDISNSMQIKHGEMSKANALNRAYSHLKSKYLESGYDLIEHGFADGLNGNPASTYLAPALEEIKKTYSKSLPDRVVLFSDGWYRDGDLRFLNLYDTSINVIADTSKLILQDVRLVDLRHNKQGFRNELALFEADLSASNYSGNARVSFLINNRQVQEKTVNFRTDAIQTVAFEHRFVQTGLHRLEVKVTAPEIKEVNAVNNNYISAIDILIDKEKILLFTDAPNWDIKFILDAIKDNNRLEAVSYTIRNSELYLGNSRATNVNWDNVTAIVIVNTANLQMDNRLASEIEGRVRQGSGLLYMGIPIPQLAEMLPIRVSNIRTSYKGLIRFQPAAAAYSAFRIPEQEMRQIPPVDYYYVTLAAQAEVLAVMDNPPRTPALAVSDSGGGKVLGASFLNLWKWQLQSNTQAYKVFISDVLAWLGNQSSGQLNAVYEPSYYLDEPINIKLTAVDDTRKIRTDLAPRISVINAGRDSIFSDFMPGDDGSYAVEFRVDKPDEYSFTISDQSTGQSTQGRFVVSAVNLEDRDWGYNLPLLSWISSQTGGRFYSIQEAMDFKPVEAERVRKIERRDFALYKKWYLISLFIVVFCLELFFRRRWGLL